ncbi:hypothetical protein EYF80_049988 [Liparis tanakae]|uniref:Uncharacterized protein n=1 Tax=Liparis tanakae TaxID=230148 RepID=A0A4Z2FF46_9TELE|nr:hypothetical protein EYF80_049988 [Liparis tanakae]
MHLASCRLESTATAAMTVHPGTDVLLTLIALFPSIRTDYVYARAVQKRVPNAYDKMAVALELEPPGAGPHEHSEPHAKV